MEACEFVATRIIVGNHTYVVLRHWKWLLKMKRSASKTVCTGNYPDFLPSSEIMDEDSVNKL
jgi:hypothetical protein